MNQIECDKSARVKASIDRDTLIVARNAGIPLKATHDRNHISRGQENLYSDLHG
jgi:hypothetical protein